MTPERAVDVRIEALKLAIATTGQPNKVATAEMYFEFIKGPQAAVAAPLKPEPVPTKGKK